MIRTLAVLCLSLTLAHDANSATTATTVRHPPSVSEWNYRGPRGPVLPGGFISRGPRARALPAEWVARGQRATFLPADWTSRKASRVFALQPGSARR